ARLAPRHPMAGPSLSSSNASASSIVLPVPHPVGTGVVSPGARTLSAGLAPENTPQSLSQPEVIHTWLIHAAVPSALRPPSSPHSSSLVFEPAATTPSL